MHEDNIQDSTASAMVTGKPRKLGTRKKRRQVKQIHSYNQTKLGIDPVRLMSRDVGPKIDFLLGQKDFPVSSDDGGVGGGGAVQSEEMEGNIVQIKVEVEDHSEPGEETGGKCAPPAVNVLDLIGQSNYSSRDAWERDLSQRVKEIVTEYSRVIGRDAREYHLYYLCVYRFLEVGFSKGFISCMEDVFSIWTKLDADALQTFQDLVKEYGQIKKMTVPLENYENASTYLTWFVRSKTVGDNRAYYGEEEPSPETKMQRNRRFYELDSILKHIVGQGGTGKLDIEEDLRKRLHFLRYCVGMTNPKDVCRMTTLWGRLRAGLKPKREDPPPRKKKETTAQNEEDRLKRKRLHRFLYEQARRDKMSKEEFASWQEERRQRRHQKYSTLTQEEKSVRNERYKQWRDSLTGEKRQRYNESVKKANLKYMSGKGKDNPERKAKFLEYLRRKLQQETPEERERRLLRYKVNTQQRKEKRTMEEQGKSPEEIQRRMDEIREELGYVKLPPKRRGRRSENRRDSETLLVANPPHQPVLTQHPVEVVTTTTTANDTLPASLEIQAAAASSLLGSTAPSQSISLLPWSSNVITLTNLINDSQITFTGSSLDPNSVTYVQLPMLTGQGGSESLLGSNIIFITTTTTTSNEPVSVQPPPQPPPALPLKLEAEAPTTTPTTIPLELDKKPIGPGSYMCDECGSTYCRLYELRCHKADVHKTPGIDFTCPDCSHPCKSSSALWFHYARYHLGPKSLSQYPEEVQIFFQKPPQSQQKKKGRRQDHNICYKCGKNFTQKASLDEHFRRVHLGIGFECDQCGKKHQSAGKLWRHKVDIHGTHDLPPPDGLDLVYCKFCGDPVMRGYQAHVKKKHPEQLQEFLNSKDNIKVGGQPRHKIRNHANALHVLPVPIQEIVREMDPSNREEEVECPVCLQKVRRRLLKRHYLDKHDTQIPCPECGRSFGVQYKMMEHYWRQHAFDNVETLLESRGQLKTYPYSNRNGPSNPSDFVLAECLICKPKVGFQVKPEIRAHFVKCHQDVIHELRRVSRMKPSFKCENCTGTFVTELELRRHLQDEHPEIKYVCEVCGVFKRSQKEVLAHERIHTDVSQAKRRGICPVCKVKMQGYLGHREKRLREHVEKTHPEKLRACDKCEFWTTEDHSLRYHVTLKHYVSERGKNYVDQKLSKMSVVCRKCGKKVKMASLQDHLQTKHGVKEEGYQCTHCTASFKKLPNYVAHEEIVHGMPLEALVIFPEDRGSPDTSHQDSRKPRSRSLKSTSRPTKVTPKRSKLKLANKNQADSDIDSTKDISNSLHDVANANPPAEAQARRSSRIQGRQATNNHTDKRKLGKSTKTLIERKSKRQANARVTREPEVSDQDEIQIHPPKANCMMTVEDNHTFPEATPIEMDDIVIKTEPSF